MELQFHQAKAKVMGIDQIKERLHLRIEQADEQVLQVLAEMAESLFKTYQPQMLEQTKADLSTDYTEHLRPLTRKEMTTEIETSMADYERGDYITLEESSKEAASW